MLSIKNKPPIFHKLRLNQKYTLYVFLFALIPFIVLAAVLFNNMQNMVIAERLDEAHRNLLQIQNRTDKTAELCNMTTQFFINSPALLDFLVRANLGDPLTTEELIAFYRNDVGAMERLVNANPYLYQVRVYFDNQNVPEIMPILYHTSRVEHQAWTDRNWTSGSWQYDYTDAIFPEEVMQPTPNLLSLVTGIEDYRLGRIGILEVAVRMNELFPDLFTAHEGFHCGFATDTDWLYYPEDGPFWGDFGQVVLSAVNEKPLSSDLSFETRLGGRPAIISSIPVSPFNGRYITVMFKDDITANLSGRRNVFFGAAAVSLLFLALVVNLLVKAMLRRFYKIVTAVRMVRDGNLDLEMPEVGDDEIGMLSDQINQMLERIRRLADENVKRELLVKDSQLRALQSQINAHFIYNVLESIKMMAEMDSHYEISDAITSLGTMLHYSMDQTSDHVALADEIGHLENYISLINLRFDYRITIRQSLPPHLMKQRLPKLTIQPIVENAVVHGIEELAMDTDILFKAVEHDSFFTLEITDYGKGIPSATLEMLRERLAGNLGEESETIGIGLKNVHDRIVTAFGPTYGISLDSVAERHTSVTIRLPYGE